MEERVYELVKNTLKKDDALEIIAQRILWYEMQLLKRDEKIDKAIDTLTFSEKLKNDEIIPFLYQKMKETKSILRGESNESN